MLFVADTATSAAIASRLATSHVRVALSRLLQTHLDGLHVLALPPTLCHAIEADPSFSDAEHAAAKKVRRNYADHGGLQKQVSIFGSLTDDPTILAPKRVGTSWRVPLRWLAMQQIVETNVVAEDLNDIHLLHAAAEDYLSYRKLFAFRVRTCPTPGGGANTDRVFDLKARTERRITICLVDSDKASPFGQNGPVATACQAVATPGLSDLRITMGRAIENALPWAMLDALHKELSPSPSTTLAQVEAASAGASKFVNMKRGMFFYDITKLGSTHCANFWSTTRISLGFPQAPSCCSAGCTATEIGSCREKFIPGLGNSTAADANSWLREHPDSSSRHRSYMPSSNATEWISIGSWVAEYSLGMPPRRL